VLSSLKRDFEIIKTGSDNKLFSFIHERTRLLMGQLINALVNSKQIYDQEVIDKLFELIPAYFEIFSSLKNQSKVSI